MANKTQYFAPVCNGVTHRISCTPHPFRRTLELCIDGETFLLPLGEREEIFRIGDEQAILCVGRRGKVRIRLRDGDLPEVSEPS